MNRILMAFLAILYSNFCLAQHAASRLKVNAKEQQFNVKQQGEQSYEINLEQDTYYHILVEQKGVDVILYVKDKNQKVLKTQDSPTGKFGHEEITFSPDVSGTFIISVKPFEEKNNVPQGNYTISVTTIPKKLKKYSLAQVTSDFNFIKNAYIETNVGLWYNSYASFDSLCTVQKYKLKDKMTAWDFYKIIAPITSYTREGHSSIGVSGETNDYFLQYGTYFPLFVKILEKKIYLLNDYANLKTKGQILTSINGIGADEILDIFTQIEPADGYNYTSKYKWIEASFSKYLLRWFGINNSFTIELADPQSGQTSKETVDALNFKSYDALRKKFRDENPTYYFSQIITKNIDIEKSTAILTINDFSASAYEGRKKGFDKYLADFFKDINTQHIENLVIDIRKNEGGSQGMEDILLSYLITKAYHKYKYVEIPSFEYSFLAHTDYKNEADILLKELSEDFHRLEDGRYLNKKGHYEGLSPNAIHFGGKLYILISGLTFSGGSEFAALAKNYTDAIFVGEETGGGYYGNTSGNFLKFTLPHTGLTGRIPLCKFIVETPKNTTPFGRGLMPDHEIKPNIQAIINHKDVEMEFVKSLISKK